ncbi:4-amino-4-deoxychorismate lyase [Pedobacter frigiditerrae]|uniref:branched-chain-amino-acid transaminase n=1 Tax=Pedobacter frigiditerrae TaxID=2530452 RepID=A0A4R0MUB6_9SPHI|nr:aminotransferase class IV [Pedobacter frigiditerrae]TCC89484.1 4-amino-4-deoxychorismate lyase [Pedobacter frigiditerrae]
MSTYILFNDEFFASEQAVIKAGNRSFKFGDGLFESMRMCNGKLQFAEQHADRLRAGMKALKMEGYALLDEYFLRQKTAELLKKNKLNGNVRFRLSVYRDGEGLYTPQSNKVGYLFESIPLEQPQYELNQKGLIIDVYDELTKQINKLSNFKTSNALLYVMAALFQKQHRLDEAMILNQNGFLCESTSSNIFVVYQNQIYTPALSEGCVAGVMRSVVLKLAKMYNLPLIEAQINPDILNEAEEVFVTNASSGIRWIMGYGKKRYFNEVAKDLSAKLNGLI